MRSRRLRLGVGVALVLIAGATLLVWRPWRLPYGGQVVCTFYRENPQPGQPTCITWAQAESRYGAWARRPTWLPAATEWQQLTVDRPLKHLASPPMLTVLYQLPHGAQIQVQETPLAVTGGAGPRVRASRLDGQRVYVSGWVNWGVRLKMISFDVKHHGYQVMSFNTSWADVDGVAESLIR